MSTYAVMLGRASLLAVLLAAHARAGPAGDVELDAKHAGVSWHTVHLTLHLLNPDDATPIMIAALGGSFER